MVGNFRSLAGMVLLGLSLSFVFPAGAKVNTALAFNGINASVETGTAVIPTSGDYTVEFCCYCPAVPAAGQTILSQGNLFYIGVDSANSLRLGDNWLTPGVTWPAGGWHHLALVKSSTNAILYLDGTNWVSRGSSLDNPGATSFRLGCQYGIQGEYWRGSLDDVRVWNVARSEEEIRTNRYATLTGAETGLVADWQMDEGRGTNITAIGSSPITGVLVNGPHWVPGWFWRPNVQFVGGNPLAHQIHTAFTNPGATMSTPWSGIAGGACFSLALKADGTVAAWGDNGFGLANVPASATNVVAITAGDSHGLALKAGGTVVAWNWGCYTQGDVPAAATNVVAIAAGYTHSLALKADGTVVAWGWNTFGQTNVPASATNIVAIAGGEYHSVALKADGTVVAWGWNGYGQTNVPASATNILAIAAGDTLSLALKVDGTVVGWGWDCIIPVPAWATNVVAIAGGGHHCLALKADGTVGAWGYNDHGQANVPASATNVVAIAAGRYHSLALKADGTVVGWGDNTYGQTNVPAVSQALLATGGTVNADVEGTYTLTYNLTNSFGLMESTNRIVVVGMPLEIVSQPVNVVALPGSAAQLRVAATGTPPLSYQWYQEKHGAIAGATNPALTWSELTTTDAGIYYVVVRNAFGPVSSRRALVAPLKWQWNGGNPLTNSPYNPYSPFFVDPGAAVTPPVVAIAAGNAHNLALKADGTVRAWGYNGSGQAIVPASATNVVAVAGGGDDSLALKADGMVEAWGYNGSGQANVPASATDVVAIAGGRDHSLAMKADGSVIAWGYADYGQAIVPVAATNIVAIAAGQFHSLALRADGTVVAWGDNRYGQTNVPAAVSDIVAIAGGGYHSLALKADGSVIAWGYNFFGEANVPEAATNVVAIAGGQFHSLALRADGTVVAWGDNSSGQANVPESATNVVAIAAGNSHSLALKADGTVVAWGDNYSGQINVPDFTQTLMATSGTVNPDVEGSYTLTYSFWGVIYTNRTVVVGERPVIASQPVNVAVVTGSAAQLRVAATGTPPLSYQWYQEKYGAIAGATNATLAWSNLAATDAGMYYVMVRDANASVRSRLAWVNPLNWQLTGHNPQTHFLHASFTDPGTTLATPVLAIAEGGLHGLALQADGMVVAWGNNDHGQTNVPASAANGVAIAGGGIHSLVLQADGTVVAWGDNYSGQSNVPASAKNVVAIAAGDSHSLALKADGTVIAWGWNHEGQTTVPATVTNIVAIAGGGFHSLALNADGTVFAWGRPNERETTVPTEATNLVAIAGGRYHSLALKANGTVVAWGWGYEGETNVPASATNVMAIAGGSYHCLALRTDGTVVAWGDNTYGQLNVPATVTNVIAIAAGGNSCLALRADGTVVGWGDNTYGQADVPAFTQTLLAAGGTVNTEVAGTYTLTYSFTDDLGAVLTTNRTVVVRQAALNPPILGKLAMADGSVGFTLSGDSGQTVVIETCTNLAAPVWVPVQTNILGSSPVNFSASIQAESAGRFYRLRTP